MKVWAYEQRQLPGGRWVGVDPWHVVKVISVWDGLTTVHTDCGRELAYADVKLGPEYPALNSCDECEP